MTNEEFAKLCREEASSSTIDYDEDVLNVMKEHNLIVMNNPETKQETATMATETTLEEKLAKEAWRLYSMKGSTLGVVSSVTHAIKNLNLKVIHAPKNPHKHFDLAVEAYGDTTIKWLYKSPGSSGWSDSSFLDPQFFANFQYCKKPKTLKFRNYKYVDCAGMTRIGHVYKDDKPMIKDFEWIGDWQEVEI